MKGEVYMAIWVIMMGAEAVIVIGSILAVWFWMHSGEEKDDIDRRLEELSAMHIAKEE